MNTTYLIIVAAIIIVILLIALVVLLGSLRQKSKRVSFTEQEAPKELTQQEKSGNYQATGGFQFAPANIDQKEPEVLKGQQLHSAPPPPDVSQQQAVIPEPPTTPAATTPQVSHQDSEQATRHDEPEATSPTTSSAAPQEAMPASPGTTETPGTPENPNPSDALLADFENEQPIDPTKVEQILTDSPRHNGDGEEAFHGVDAAKFAVAESESAPFEASGSGTGSEIPSETSPDARDDIQGASQYRADISDTDNAEPGETTTEISEEASLEFPETPLFASLVQEKPVDGLDIEEVEQAAEAALSQAEAAGSALETTPVPDTPPAHHPATEIEEITPAVGRLGKLRSRLARSQNVIGQGVLGILSAGDLDEDAWEEIEDTLLMADLGTKVTLEVVDSLRDKIAARGVASEAEARAMLRETLIEACKPELDRSIRAMPNAGKPAVVLVVGVNGTGKTTTTGKLARVLVSMGHTVLLGAADTFRAAAADQLETWGRRVGAATVRGAEAADPASVAFDAVARGVEDQVDVVLIDTAGRLHTSVGLMDQLGKVKRVVEKKAAVDEVLLVLDATVGQNGLMQARTFRDVVDITGVVLTKLDGTAKGGIVFQVQEELGVPVKLVGLGEGADDLAPFEPESFVDALLG